MSDSKQIPRITPFNPLDKKNLGESVAEALLLRPVHEMPPTPFIGAGIYAIYYTGDFSDYAEIAKKNRKDKYGWPIYVGKAVPAGARKGGFGLDSDPGQVLYKRLVEHTTSIQQTENLDIRDFACRYLVVDDIWIPLAESMLIEMFSPLWNQLIDGFGNHDPGSGRYNQQKSQWDILHPGRPWATKLKDPLKRNNNGVREAVAEYIVSTSPKIQE
ncbi:MAG: Eco29kI family restriction endonuclease [Nitrospirota bacterium]|nr:Eco29kI family restriction endonuclease [Nitrospirota bacterium]